MAGALLGHVVVTLSFRNSAGRGRRFAWPGGELRSVLGGVLKGGRRLAGPRRDCGDFWG